MVAMVPGQPLKAEFEFPVNDHVGALALSAEHRIVFGANWDTEAVYLWDFGGRLQRTLNGPDLESRGLGVVSGPNGRAGLAVQIGRWWMIAFSLQVCCVGLEPCLSHRKAA
jgi:hypothetical protein